MKEEIWGMEVGDPVEDEHTNPFVYSEVIKERKHTRSEGGIRWTKGEIIFFVILGLSMLSLVLFSIIRDAPHP